MNRSFVSVILGGFGADNSADDKKEKKNVLQHLKKSGKEVVSITENQMHSFAGNMLELQGKSGSVLVMSKQANESLTNEQLIKLEKHAAILVVDLKIYLSHLLHMPLMKYQNY